MSLSDELILEKVIGCRRRYVCTKAQYFLKLVKHMFGITLYKLRKNYTVKYRSVLGVLKSGSIRLP